MSPIGESGYLDKLEIETAINILKIIDNHHHDVALISSMLSPAFGFDIDELIAIRKKYSKRDIAFYKAIENYANSENDKLSSKVNDFQNKLKRYRLMSRHMPIGEFVWFILSDTMLYDAVGALPGGRVREQNLRLLAERADAYSMVPGRGLSSFIQHIQTIGDSVIDFEPAQLNDNSDSVKFMSIHKSKGLEFPVVILIKQNLGIPTDCVRAMFSGILKPHSAGINLFKFILFVTSKLVCSTNAILVVLLAEDWKFSDLWSKPILKVARSANIVEKLVLVAIPKSS